MKKEIVIRKNIYTGKEHKLIWSGKGKLYYFQPAEDWMPTYFNYEVNENTGERIILSFDSDGFGYPVCVGDNIDNMTIGAIINIDDKTGIMFN